MFSSYEVKAYKDSERTEESTTFDVEDNMYFSFIGTPDTATADKPIIESIEGDRVCWTSTGTSPNYIYLSSAGTATFTFVSAAGIRQSIEITVQAPAPESISFWDDMPEIVPVNGLVPLPSCDISPYAALQSYEWKVVEGAEYGEVVYNADADVFSIKGLTKGTVKVQANSTVNPEIVTDIYEIEVVEAKTAEEMHTVLTETDWAVNDGVIYHASFNTDGTAEINFGYEQYYDSDYNRVTAENETKYTFNWALDYENGIINVTNGAWENRQENGNYATFTDPVITPSLLGEKVNINFGGYYNWDFVEAMSADELHEKFIGQEVSGYFMSFNYVEVYFSFTADTITMYQITYDEEWNPVISNELTVGYSWNADGNIELAADTTLTVENYSGSYTITVNKVLEVEQAFGAYFMFNFTDADGNSYSERISVY